MILGGFLGWEGVANEWEWPKTPSLTLPHVKFEHDKTFHGLIFNEIFKKNTGIIFASPLIWD